MSSTPGRNITVEIGPDSATTTVGTAYFNTRRGRVTTNFTYSADWFAAADGAWSISPDIPARDRSAFADGLPGALADSTPDRWGRNLISRSRNAQARVAGHALPELTDVDYLLGVSDLTRQGALRYRTSHSSDFRAQEGGVPKLIALPQLLAASDSVGNGDSHDNMSAVTALLEAGSGSLGGARPKASIMDDGKLYIAKFPHHADEWDVMAWEATTLELAQMCGINVPSHRRVKVGEHTVLLVKRFDRVGEIRVPYVSGMTLLEGTDGEEHDYTDLAEALMNFGSNVISDLHKLWRRIAFSIAVHNTDDHMRNHGFLWDRGGWTLSPQFDVNPNPARAIRRSTTINFENDPNRELEALMSSADIFRLTSAQANSIWSEVMNGVAQWRHVARRNAIPESETRYFVDAFWSR